MSSLLFEVSTATVGDVTATDAEGVDDYVDAAAVNRSKGADYAEDFNRVLASRPVSFLFLFGPIVSTQFHRYRSIRYQFTVQVNI